MKLKDILDRFRQESLSQSEKGTKFEEFIKSYLKTDPVYSSELEEIWLWNEFPYNDKVHDIGIDLVAKDINDEYWAIQCKFYAEEHYISKKDIDSFLSASGRSFSDSESKKCFFSKRFLFSTTDKWSSNAEETIVGQKIPVTRIGIQDLQNSVIDWDAFDYDNYTKLAVQSKKTLRLHQQEALKATITAFETQERGKLIMSCGTGKTFTSLHIVTEMLNHKGNALFLVPSISLLSQTLREWMSETDVPIYPIAVCSDNKASKASEDMSVVDIIFPASTNVDTIRKQYNHTKDRDGMTVFFSTYQSIDVVIEAQKSIDFEFDIIICDEAHRTTGATLANKEASFFTKVHSNNNIKAKKRLYMTATPRVYSESSKQKAKQNLAEVWSMDDTETYGHEFYRLGFADSIRLGLLSDYKVIVLGVDEKYVDRRFQTLFTDESNELNLDDITKLVGCWNGLSKKSVDIKEFDVDPGMMKRAIAFTNSIKDSKMITRMFERVISEYDEENDGMCEVQIQHVDGTMNAVEKTNKLNWLKEDTGEEVCRILSNARCLSEGIDVPALDAVIFMNPRSSIIDIIQSVGRVMRKPQNGDKKYGYIILPIAIPSDVKPEEALNDNERYKIVWNVLQALRAHDDRLDNTINKIDLNKKKPSQILIGHIGGEEDDDGFEGAEGENGSQLDFLKGIQDWKDAIYSKLVLKCGDRQYWETWAKDVAAISERHILRINTLIEKNDPEINQAFVDFLSSLRSNLNSTITQDDAIEMLAQHMVTKPVFNALFENYSFVDDNPVSHSMENMLSILKEHSFENEIASLDNFYKSVRERAGQIDNLEGKQRVIIELYEKFFKTAFPKQVEKLGIVYTPVEVVDFIIHSVEYILNQEFGKSMTDKGVEILDPFTGTGTFITRLLTSGIIKPEDMAYKYANEINANEIVLLAYYIATVNIEETYHFLMGMENYEAFNGIVLTDTFQMSEDEVKGNLGLPENSERIKRQKEKKITCIIGNPPYSIGQGNQNDNNQNVEYPLLNKSIEDSYAKDSVANLKRGLYDNYIRAFRWATDRLPVTGGIIGFVTNGAFIDNTGMDGFRKNILSDFTSVYVLNLRGNQRTSGELSRKEGGKIFGSGSRAPVAITILVNNPANLPTGQIHYYDIGDYKDRQNKLETIKETHDISNIEWLNITPDVKNDWVNLRNPEFEAYIPLGEKNNKKANTIFNEKYSLGIVTGRDAWAYNFSKDKLTLKIKDFIEFYKQELERYNKIDFTIDINDFVLNDSKKIKWTVNLKNNLQKGNIISYKPNERVAYYRPFCKEYLYFERSLIERILLQPGIFPDEKDNIAIIISGTGASKGFSALVTNCTPNLHTLDTCQCFPLYSYEERTGQQSILEVINEDNYIKHDGITDYYLARCQKKYEDKSIIKEDIFYFVYGLLHSPTYRLKYAADLKKQLPRIPFVENFWEYSKAGRKLADLHLNYETIVPYPLEEIGVGTYHVEKMRFAGKGNEKDKSTIIYNSSITLSGIPEKSYEYVINGKSALEWIMERYQITTDKESGIINDPNDWCKEVGDERYIIDLVKRIVRVSIETVDIVNGLPELKIIKS